jgi:hypothetical protein
MPAPAIVKGDLHFNSLLFSGTGGSSSKTGLGFSPDVVWIKRRSSSTDWGWFDVQRGVQKNLKKNKAESESTEVNGLTAFGSDGFTVGSSGDYNGSGGSFCSWNWYANDTETNNTGTLTGATINKNVAAGFSLVKYAGSSSGTKTVGHGLGKTLDWIIIKNTSEGRGFFVYHNAMTGGNYYMRVDQEDAQQVGDVFNNTAPTSSVFSIQDPGSLNTNGSGDNFIAMCFASIDGYSRFGRYTGNGSSNGPMVYTGFEPAMIIVKCVSNGSTNWCIIDNKRDTENERDDTLFLDSSSGGSTSGFDVDFNANGFKVRNTDGDMNTDGRTYLYSAWARRPFIGDGTNPLPAN